MTKVGRSTALTPNDGPAEVREVGFAPVKAEIAWMGNLRDVTLAPSDPVQQPVWTTAKKSMNRFVGANLGYSRPLTPSNPYLPAITNSVSLASTTMSDGPLSPADRESLAQLSLMSPSHSRVSVKDYINPNRSLDARSPEDRDSRIPRKDKSKPWTPPALSVSDVQELMEQSVKSPTQIPAGPVEEEGENLLEAFETARDARGFPYRVTVKTGDAFGAGTDADISMILIGELGASEELHLDEKGVDNFERNRTDIFQVWGSRVGKVEKIDIGFGRSKTLVGSVSAAMGDAWLLESIQVVDLQGGWTYTATANEWINGKRRRVTLVPTAVQGAARFMTTYKVTVKTGNEMGAGTDADIAIRLQGSEGETEEILLEHTKNLLTGYKKDLFERNQLDSFDVSTINVGQLQSIVIGYSKKRTASGAMSTLLGDAWKLAWVEVTDTDNGTTSRFDANAWVDLKVPRLTIKASGTEAASPEKPSAPLATQSARSASPGAAQPAARAASPAAAPAPMPSRQASAAQTVKPSDVALGFKGSSSKGSAKAKAKAAAPPPAPEPVQKAAGKSQPGCAEGCSIM